MNDKAIVRKTGEIMSVKRHWIVKMMTLTLEFPEGLEDLNTVLDEKFGYKQDIEKQQEGDHYILSDNKEYMGEDLIVGLDNIREYKITNQIKIDE